MKKVLLSFAFLAGVANGADILLASKGSDNIIITQKANSSLRFSEKTLTNRTLGLLAMQLYMQQKSIGVKNEEMASALSNQGLFMDSAYGECQLAIDLHFDPKNMPDGKGSGMWIATDEANFPLAQKILSNFAKEKGKVYRDKPFPLKDLEVSQAECPTLYINLDTNVEHGKSGWFLSPQSTMYYSKKLADAITKSL